jgi:hypothetical protein
MRSQLLCWLALAVVALVVAGCEEDQSSGSHGAATTSPEARQRIFSLLAPPEVSFQVIFREGDPYSEEGPYFVWTQGNGRRRWDWVGINSGKATSGDFTIDTSFSSVGLGDEGMTCGWYAGPDLPPGQVELQCSEGSHWSLPAFLPVADALHSYVGDWLLEQDLAGRTASCYSFDFRYRYIVSVFCVDPMGIPLALTTVSHSQSNLTRELEAISVSTAQQDIVLPTVEWEEHPILGRQAQAVVPISTLQLPDFSQFGE